MSYPSGNFGQQSRPRSDSPLATPIDTRQIVLQPLPVELFSSVAEKAAAHIHQFKGRDANKYSQIRKFYDELVMWHDKVHTSNLDKTGRDALYQELAPFIKMMNAKVTYAAGRKHVDENFRTLLSHCINQINSAETLRHAKLFMEAFMGFYKALEK